MKIFVSRTLLLLTCAAFLSCLTAPAQTTLLADFNGRSGGAGIKLDNYATGFTPSMSGNLTKIGLPIYVYAYSDADVQIDLYTASGNVPDSLIQTLGILYKADMVGGYNWSYLTIASPPAVTSGTKYYLVFTYVAGSQIYALNIGGHQDADKTPAYTWGNTATRSGGIWTAGKSVLGLQTYIDDTLDMHFRAAAEWAFWNANTWRAQSFTSTTNATIAQVDVHIGNLAAGEDSDLTVDLYTFDTGTGKPGKLIKTLGTLAAADINSSYTFKTLAVEDGPIIYPGLKYYIVQRTGIGYAGDSYATNIRPDSTSANSMPCGYDWGNEATSTDSGTTWTISRRMLNFKVYAGPLPPGGTIIYIH